jgi:hypothetical protein
MQHASHLALVASHRRGGVRYRTGISEYRRERARTHLLLIINASSLVHRTVCANIIGTYGGLLRVHARLSQILVGVVELREG